MCCFYIFFAKGNKDLQNTTMMVMKLSKKWTHLQAFYHFPFQWPCGRLSVRGAAQTEGLLHFLLCNACLYLLSMLFFNL